MAHLYVNSNPDGFDSNCLVCGGKNRDAIHYGQILPAIYELDLDGEATGIVHSFCADACRSRYIEEGRVIGRYSRAETELPNEGLVCEFCQDTLDD
jgi:hypothetical protein